MHEPEPKGEIVFRTPWFNLRAAPAADSPEPYYTIHCCDFAMVIALDVEGRLLLVRQFRHGVGAHTLEWPSGHVDPGDTPEQTARKELLEETGYTADEFELLTTLSPSTARFSNRLWCFFARNARPHPGAVVETGIELRLYGKGLKSLLTEEEFCSAPNYGVLCVAILSGKLAIQGPSSTG